MAKKSLQPLTESMFYVLLAFHKQDMCGAEISDFVQELTSRRVKLGPGTLYSILSLFQDEKLIKKVGAEGRRVTYSLTASGEKIYEEEITRLQAMLEDALGGHHEKY